MPFMKGSAPIRRTIRYLEAGKLHLKDNIKIFSVNYNTKGAHHEGTKDFVFWNMPQIQYKNPDVQCITFKNMTPSPFIKCYYEDGRNMIIDLEGRNRIEILNHLLQVVGKTTKRLEAEAKQREKKENPANFGACCDRACICEIPGQVPCPGIVPLPYCMRGKYKDQPYPGQEE